MAITESKRQSDLEKRLKFLRQQVYGRSEDQKISLSTHQKSDTLIHRNSDRPISDVTYLFQDLSKIGILASLAIGIQIILFFLTKGGEFKL